MLSQLQQEGNIAETFASAEFYKSHWETTVMKAHRIVSQKREEAQRLEKQKIEEAKRRQKQEEHKKQQQDALSAFLTEHCEDITAIEQRCGFPCSGVCT